MNPFSEYLLKSSFSLALFYSLFWLIMRNDKTHALNRFLLLGIMFLSAVMPFVKIPDSYRETSIKQVYVIKDLITPQVITEMIPTEINSHIVEPGSFSVNYWQILYFLVVVIFAFRLIIGVVKVIQIISRAEKKEYKKNVLAIVKEVIQPFSFLKYIVLSKKDYTVNHNIVVAHEQAHIQYHHSIDLMISEIFMLAHWFNPFMWLLRNDLKLIHEFQADKAVLNTGIDAKKYQLLVLEKSVGERRFALANSFTQKPILKRLKMMKKNNESRMGIFKILFFIPVVAFLLMSFSKPVKNILNENAVFSEVVSQPEVHKNKFKGLLIEIKRGGNYIDDKMCPIEEVVTKAKSWQKTGREDIHLLIDEQIPLDRIDEVREALSSANVYHVNQSFVNSDEIIYPAGDVSSLAKLKNGSFSGWMQEQLKVYFKDIPEDLEFRVSYSFIVDKNGKVKDAHLVKPCDYKEINDAYEQVLSKIPDWEWEPAIKSGAKVSVIYTIMGMRKVKVTHVN